ncbi:hypothetical protein EVG20_g10966 [Dentipellis fragilis]|uniref:Uncharacterized protein n=1 Tax=Dentipellis fragilis TaxID=205917 RepID=A0A4Y9XP41_9AGAM|nr:hypothetical protein EVG20_g10966 [Dentipellis fragilis]
MLSPPLLSPPIMPLPYPPSQASTTPSSWRHRGIPKGEAETATTAGTSLPQHAQHVTACPTDAIPSLQPRDPRVPSLALLSLHARAHRACTTYVALVPALAHAPHRGPSCWCRPSTLSPSAPFPFALLHRHHMCNARARALLPVPSLPCSVRLSSHAMPSALAPLCHYHRSIRKKPKLGSS